MSIEHTKIYSTVNLCYLLDSWLTAIIWSKFDLNSTWLCHKIVLASILISKGMSTNNDWGSPSWDASWNVGNHNWLSKYCSIKDVSNGSIWTSPHLLQIEFLNSSLIWSDGGTFDCNLMFLCCLSSINCNLIICLISASH